MAIKRIAILCSDYRRDGKDDALNDGETLIFRNAGGRAEPLLPQLKKALDENKEISEISAESHANDIVKDNDQATCWGAGEVATVSNGKESSEPLKARFGSSVKSYKTAKNQRDYETRVAVEENRSALEGLAAPYRAAGRNIAIHSELAIVGAKDAEKHMLVVAGTMVARGATPKDAYVIRDGSHDHAVAEIEVFCKLARDGAVHLSGIAIMPSKNPTQIETFAVQTMARYLQEQDYVKQAGLAVTVLANHSRTRSAN